MPVAKVASTSPLAVRLKGDTTDTPAQRKSSTLAALSVGDDVWVDIDPDERLVFVAYKAVSA
jgi:hypothetical protein